MLLARVLRLRGHMRARERWTRADLERHQEARLDELLTFARARSPFYRELHGGLEKAPFDALPVVSKAMLMDQFDRVVTDPLLHRAEIDAHLTTAGDGPYLGRYWVTATSGSTGRPGLFLFDRTEWAHVLASFSRGPDYAGLPTGPTHRTRTAIVSSTNPMHMSSRVGATLRSPFVPTLRLDAIAPLAEIVERLNTFRPAMLVAYASMAGVLADEQLAGRLRVRPRAVMVSSEVLTDAARHRVESAWRRGVLFEQYAATEGAGLAAECQQHRGLHLFEDLSIVEVVDEGNQPVPPGTFGAKVLLTVLWSRTQPLIRYELNDSLRMSADPCPDGRLTRLIDAIQGRTEDTLHLLGTNGANIAIHPNVIHNVFDGALVGAWQVVQQSDGLRVLVAEPRPGFDAAALGERLRVGLIIQGALSTLVLVEQVAAIPRTLSGKAPLIRALSPQVPGR